MRSALQTGSCCEDEWIFLRFELCIPLLNKVGRINSAEMFIIDISAFLLN